MFGFGLTFRRPETEHAYMRWVINGRLRKNDREFLCAFLLLVLATLCRFAMDRDSLVYHFPVCMVTATRLVWDIMARRGMGLEELTVQRTGMVVGTRFVVLFINWALDRREHPIVGATLLHAMLTTGTIMSMLLAGCLWLKFEHHFPFQLAATVGLVFMSTKRRCATLMDTSGASTVRLIAHNVDYWAKRMTGAMYGRCGNEPWICPCLLVMVWLHVFVNLVVESFLLWKLERRSRREFIQTLPEDRMKREGLDAGGGETVYTTVMHVFLLVVTFAVTWELCYFLVDAVNSWGV